ncbi:MAG: glycosyl hydrolase [Bryobacteraceae bacterium]
MGIKTICAGLAVALSLAAQTPISVQVLNQTNSTKGVNGRLQSFMSTAFQPAEWDDAFFTSISAAPGFLWQLAPQHIRLQPVSQGVPLTSSNQWDFSTLDAVLIPVIGTGDHSPELQLATAPASMSNSNGDILTTTANFQAFAAYCANVVRYYNTGGFDVNGVHYQSPSPYHITWWGIFNEPNGNEVTASQYVTLYNIVVPAMQAVDPTIKFVAIEESDYGNQSQQYVPTFVQQVTAQVDAVALHYYSTCNQRDTDQTIMGSIPGFLSDLQYVQQQLQINPALSNVPVWVTENNVNADYAAANGMSACNPGEVYVTDLRATDAFFAAWRPYLFSQLAQGGNQSLYHWDFDADAEFAEVDYTAGTTYLSYWVDYELAHLFPSPPGATILQLTNSDPSALEALAVRNDDGSVVILLANHAVRNSTDNNGPGVAATVTLDVSALGSFSLATVTSVNANTDPSAGPSTQSVTPQGIISVSFPGYGVAFVRLAQAQPQILPGGIVNAASYAGGGVAPGEIIAIYGTNLGPATGVSYQVSAGVVPNLLAGVRVWFDGIAAPVLYAAAGQVNVVAPYAIANEANTSVRVEYLGAFSPALSVPVLPAQPGVFTLNGQGTGPAAVLNALLNQPYSVNSAANPVPRGDYIMIYATGEGAMSPAGVDGLVALAASPGPPPPAVTVQIGGQPATVSYAGNAPGFVEGAFQVNAIVPTTVTPGSAVPIVVAVGTASSLATATIAVQ